MIEADLLKLSPKRLTLLALEQAAMLERLRKGEQEPIAVVGIGCRFPGGVNNPESYWDLLREGRDGIREVPRDRWDVDAYYDPDPDTPGKMATRWGGFLDAIDQFDPEFFGIAPREAVAMDPQQRLILEVCWEALEDAALTPPKCEGAAVGVYLGVTGGDYVNLLFGNDTLAGDAYALTGNARNAIAGRLSYLLGFCGPCLVLDSACSSSLVAVHLACQSLRSNECRVALAGGVNVILSPEITIAASRARMLARDGRCKTFDARADGFVRSEGAGVVVLKRLADAQADHDRILTIIRGTAVNQDGRSGGFTVPNAAAQQALIEEALRKAAVAGRAISYLEAHGTGTPLGDPVEVEAAAQALAVGRAPDRPLVIGSVKTNLGHLEAAAGIAGLIKVVLALQHRQIPPHLHLQKLNPAIDLARIPALIPSELMEWPKGCLPLASVSSFGASGTNAHAILEAAPEQPSSQPDVDGINVLAISASSAAALDELAQRYEAFLAERKDLSFADICWSANTGRAQFAHRLAILARSREEACQRLATGRRKATPGVFRGVAALNRAPETVASNTGLEALAALWAQGKAVDWEALNGGHRRRRVPLPHYPFQRRRLWIERQVEARAPRQARAEDLLFTVEWREQQIALARTSTPVRWLIFSETSDIGDRLRHCLLDLGQEVELHPPSRDVTAAQLDTILRELRPQRVVYLAANADPEDICAAVDASCWFAACLLQAIVQTEAELRPSVALVTYGAVGPDSGKNLLVGGALWGLGRTAQLEYPDLTLALIDHDPQESDEAAQQLATELSVDDAEVQRVLRSGKRYVPRLRQAGETITSPDKLRANATYLITGGLGALGLQIAAGLVDGGARRVLLLGRSEASPSAARKIAELRDRGAEIVTAPADVCQLEMLKTVLAENCPPNYQLRGIVHAAGVLDDGILLRQTRERFARALAPKVDGTWNLHLATLDLPLDWFVLFSSTASLLGSMGQANYAAGNAFLDALAQYRRARGLCALSINWGPWSGEGMAAPRDEDVAQRRAEWGMQLLDPAQGVSIFQGLAGASNLPAQIGVIPFDWSRLGVVMSRIPPLLSDVCARQSKPGEPHLLARVQDAPADRRIFMLGEIVHEYAARVLGRKPPLPVDQGFFELGMDSLMALELQNSFQRGFGDAVRLPSTLIFDCPTVPDLTAYLAERIGIERPVSSPAIAKQTSSGRVAIVGVGLRFPGGAHDLDTFWQLLKSGRAAIDEVPADRWDKDLWYDPDPEARGRIYTRHGAFLAGIDQFDAAFFGISPREAAQIDPQQRLLLEVAWEALERAGIDPARISRTGVFIGISTNEYVQRMMGSIDPESVDAYVGLGNSLSAAAGRLSFHFGLQGPSMVVDTACSSSLVALHLACRSLLEGECSVALAGGVNLMLSPFGYLHLSRARMLAPDGRCKVFDAAADGYGRGEGCAVFALKRLEDATDAGDDILAVIRGSAVNQDGRSAGFTVPRGGAQRDVIRSALDAAGVEAREIGYVEAHGTGTPLGDPVEVRALADALGGDRDPLQPIWIGSVKANVGHLEAAAGAAGVIKAALAIQKGEIPPQPHFKQPNPHIAWDELPVCIPTELIPWPAGFQSRLAGVSSFGFTGTNAHAVLEAPPPRESHKEELEGQSQILLLSAKSDERLRMLATSYQRRLADCSDSEFADFCFSANTGRAAFDHRLAIVAGTPEEAIIRLDAFLKGKQVDGVRRAVVGPASAPDAVEECDPATAWVNGASVDFCQTRKHRRVPVPVSPFIRQRHWFVEADSPKPAARTEESRPEFPGRRISSPAMRDIVFETVVDAHSQASIADHRVHGEILVAGAVHIATLCEAAQALLGEVPIEIERIEFLQPNILAGRQARRSQLVLTKDGRDEFLFRLLSVEVGHESDEDAWLNHAKGRLLQARSLSNGHSLEDIRRDAQDWAEAPVSALYDEIRAIGVELGPSFRCVERLWYGQGRSIGRLSAPAPQGNLYRLHFGLMDSCFQVVAAAFGSQQKQGGDRQVFVPASVDRFQLLRPAHGPMWCHGWVQPGSSDQEFIIGGFELFDDQRHIVAAASGLRMHRAPKETLLRPSRSNLQESIYELLWEAMPHARRHKPALNGSWVVVEGPDQLGRQLAIEVMRAGGECRVVSGLAEADPGSFAGIIDLRAVGFSFGDKPEDTTLSGECARRCQDVIDLLRRMRDRDIEARQLVIVTSGAQDAGKPLSLIHPEQAVLWGLGRVLGVEEQKLRPILVDLDPAASVEDSAGLLCAELAEPGSEMHVAFRDGERVVARLDAFRARNLSEQVLRLDPHCSYLITGGTGALGRIFARWLVERGARHVVLAGRRGATLEAEMLAVELAGRGAAVRCVACDAASERDLQALIAELQASPHPLRGVLHAAGVLDDAPYEKMNRDSFEKVFKPKLEGAWLLDRATRDIGPDFMIMFSSAAALLGSAGQANYAAANAYLDALARARRARGLPALSVNWGPWENVGMSGGVSEHLRSRWAAAGLQPLRFESAREALEMLIRSDAVHAAVCPVNWEKFLARLHSVGGPSLLARVVRRRQSTAPQSGNLRARLFEAPASGREDVLLKVVRDEIASVLMLESSQSLEPNCRLFEAGLDSLMATELKNRLESGFDLRLPSTLLFDNPTPELLARALASELLGKQDDKQPIETEEMSSTSEDLDSFSDEELARLIDAEFERVLQESPPAGAG